MKLVEFIRKILDQIEINENDKKEENILNILDCYN